MNDEIVEEYIWAINYGKLSIRCIKIINTTHVEQLLFGKTSFCVQTLDPDNSWRDRIQCGDALEAFYNMAEHLFKTINETKADITGILP